MLTTSLLTSPPPLGLADDTAASQPRHDGVRELGKYRGHAGTGGADGASYWRLLRDGGRGVLGRTTLDVAELVPDSDLDSLEVGNELQLNGAGEVQLWESQDQLRHL